MKKDYDTQQPPIPTFCGIPANGVSCDDAVDFGTSVTFPRYWAPATTRSSRSSTGSSA